MSNWVKGTTDYNGVVRCQACNCDLTGKKRLFNIRHMS